MAELGPVIISAGGNGTRIRAQMDGVGYPEKYPKHLLPTGGPNSETLLGRIIRQASSEPLNLPPVVYATQSGHQYMRDHPDVGQAEFQVTSFRFSMDPLYYRLRQTGARVFGCAGDFYSDFTWAGFLSAHEKSKFPMSVLAGEASGSKRAAIFDIQDGAVTGFSRPLASGPGDYKNIGAYIIDPHKDVISVMDELLPPEPELAPDDDTIFSKMVTLGLVGAITTVGLHHFNVNTPDEYQAMLDYTTNYAAMSAGANL